MTSIVTGGAGFIGSHLVRRLVEDGHDVCVIDDLSTGKVERLDDVMDRVTFIRADLASTELVDLLAGAERVFHLAAIPSVPRSVRDPLPTNASIVSGTLRLLIAARDAGVRQFVHSSSSSVYGDTDVSPKHERLPTQPMSPYAVAKLAAEAYVRVFSKVYGLSTVALRYFNVFGPYQDPTSEYAAVVPRFITAAQRDRSIVVYGDGRQTRDFTYVDNVVDANIAAASSTVSGTVYNVAAGDPHSVLDLVENLSRVMGRALSVRHEPPRPGDIRDSHADISAARIDLGWTPKVGFEDGLRRTADWFLK